LAQHIKTNTEKTRRDFSEAALATSQHIANTTNEMTRVLTSVIDRVVKETFRMTQKIRRMNQRLQEWDKVLEDMEEMLQEVREQKQETTRRLGATKNEFWRMEQQIQREIQASERRRKELEGNIVEEVQKLHAASQRLKLRLKSLKL
jgi:predicted phage-related endonuclease